MSRQTLTRRGFWALILECLSGRTVLPRVPLSGYVPGSGSVTNGILTGITITASNINSRTITYSFLGNKLVSVKTLLVEDVRKELEHDTENTNS